ncbi:phospholipase C [Oxalobacteraceae bacterium GrIS 1.11]
MTSTSAALRLNDGPSNLSGNLDKIKHVVVLMMENRSFDHMLGYLSLEEGRADIDGLVASYANFHDGKPYPVHHLERTALGSQQDPGHDGASVARQLANGNGGFVDDYALNHPGDPEYSLVMGYYNGADLPAYDFLARQFCVCDRWFSSVPGATWPNRLYAMSGRAAGSKDSKRVPLYGNKSFLRQLDQAGVSWKFYSDWKPWTLALTDDHYRSSENYEPLGSASRRYGFIGDALAGTLPSLSWIDPHFFENDDHPPADVRAGQALVTQVYRALAAGPAWNDTLFIVCYDEHGGFYDHVAPGPAPDNDPAFQQYGVRVPALVISPWIPLASVYHGVLDHTSIIKTVLRRFCRAADGGIPDLGHRTAAAADLGPLLSEPRPRPAPAMPDAPGIQAAAWLAAGALFAAMSEEEAGAIAAEKEIAKTTKKALSVNGKTAPSSIARRRRKRGGPSPVSSQN